MVRTELPSHMPLQGPKCCVPLEWGCSLLFGTAVSSVIKNYTFVRCIFPPRLKKTLKISYLIQ